MRLQATLEVDEDSPATPFEQALARAHGLPGEPGRVAWAAFDTGTVGAPCAWLRPCHWQVGMDQVSLLEPGELALGEAESRALLAALRRCCRTTASRCATSRPTAGWPRASCCAA
jgi:hypothetical protein